MKTEYFILLHRKNSFLHHRNTEFVLNDHAYAGIQLLQAKEQQLTISHYKLKQDLVHK